MGENLGLILIIGQPKAGTTSLFERLSYHPSICGSKIKETRFFIDQNYPLATNKRYNGNNIQEYLEYFDLTTEDFILDASPDYLYSRTPMQLKKEFKEVYIIIVERNPNDRLFSLFRYYKQQSVLRKNVTFDQFIEQQSTDQVETELHKRGLMHCHYSYIDRYQKVFGEKCLIINFGDLTNDPLGTNKKIFRWIKLTETNIYQPEKNINKTAASRSFLLTKYYRQIRRKTSYLTLKYPLTRRLLNNINQKIKKFIYIDDFKTDMKLSEKNTKKIENYLSTRFK
jgi:hypothetical protein